jgi:hypothetical protein
MDIAIDYRDGKITRTEPALPVLATIRMQILNDSDGVFEVIGIDGLCLALTFEREHAEIIAAAFEDHLAPPPAE